MRKIIKETMILIIKGGVIGTANIIPGVSGGTLAVILGVYDKMIESIANFFAVPEKRIEYIFFLLRIFLPAAFTIALLANFMDFLLTKHFQATIFLFMGLILGGIPAIITAHKDMKIKTSRLLAFVLGIIGVMGIFVIKKKYGIDAPIAVNMEALTGKDHVVLAISGILAGAAMIIPGISGSFVLVLLGQYAVIIAAIKNMCVKPIIAMGAGVILGILMCSKLIEICLEKIPSLTYYFILGLVLASFYTIFPGIPDNSVSGVICAGTFTGGAIIAYLLSKFK